jgi:hypothetical protein
LPILHKPQARPRSRFLLLIIRHSTWLLTVSYYRMTHIVVTSDKDRRDPRFPVHKIRGLLITVEERRFSAALSTLSFGL